MFSTLTIQKKITGLLIVYFIIAIMAIASTLFVVWRLDGSAAAINDAGSQRMRSYQISFLLAQYIENPTHSLKVELDQAITKFEQTFAILDKGDPIRPLLLPANKLVHSSLHQLQQTWYQKNKLYVNDILIEKDKAKAHQLLNVYSGELSLFVTSIDDFVRLLENYQVQSAGLLRTYQIALVSLALIGTILLILTLMRMVITPVQRLKEGLDKMALGDFSVRLPVTNSDELSSLAVGFNYLGQQLQEIYATLEERINTKTQSLELKSRELSSLYETTSFLNAASTTEAMCDGILGKMVFLFNAKAGVIRLVDPKGKGVPIVACYGVSEDFLTKENQLQCGNCLCGDTAKNGATAISYNMQQSDHVLASEDTCRREGFNGIVSVPIKIRKQIIGVFNLFFPDPYVLPPSELKLLETVSQHLGSAIENQHFVEREKEMAISEERNLLAQELHDSIAQSLAFLNIQVQLLQDWLQKGKAEQAQATLAQIREGIQESYDDVRELLVHFRTRTEHDDIDVAIRSALEKFEGQTGIKTDYRYEGRLVQLQPETILQVMHILHECLSNIRKHSQASLVNVTFKYDAGCQMIIHDNGVGFDDNETITETHVGLSIMRERTHRIHGTLSIDSAVGHGTKIRLNLPLSSNSFLATESLQA